MWAAAASGRVGEDDWLASLDALRAAPSGPLRAEPGFLCNPRRHGRGTTCSLAACLTMKGR